MDSASTRRVLGAMRIVDSATRATLTHKLVITATGVRFLRNRSHLYVIFTAPGLEHHTSVDRTPPDSPDLGSVLVTLTIHDPTGQYLPRIATLGLPRDPDPNRAASPDSLFQPVEVPLLASAGIRTRPNWSLVRSALRTPGDQPVAGALVLVRDAGDSTVLGRGISDERGEVVVVVPGIPITRFASTEPDTSDDDEAAPTPVVESSTAGVAELSFPEDASWPVDPDQLETDHGTQLIDSQAITLRTGRTERVLFEIP